MSKTNTLQERQEIRNNLFPDVKKDSPSIHDPSASVATNSWIDIVLSMRNCMEQQYLVSRNMADAMTKQTEILESLRDLMQKEFLSREACVPDEWPLAIEPQQLEEQVPTRQPQDVPFSFKLFYACTGSYQQEESGTIGIYITDLQGIEEFEEYVLRDQPVKIHKLRIVTNGDQTTSVILKNASFSMEDIKALWILCEKYPWAIRYLHACVGMPTPDLQASTLLSDFVDKLKHRFIGEGTQEAQQWWVERYKNNYSWLVCLNSLTKLGWQALFARENIEEIVLSSVHEPTVHLFFLKSQQKEQA